MRLIERVGQVPASNDSKAELFSDQSAFPLDIAARDQI